MSTTVGADAVRLVSRETVRTGRYALIGADLHRARRLWFALHGYGQLAARFLRPFAGLVPADTCVIAPEGLNRFYRDQPRADGSHLQYVGASWMTREGRDDDIADTLRWLYTVYDDVRHVAPVSIPVGVLAFSQGVATATRWISSGFIHPQALCVWAGSPAHDVEDESMQSALRDAQVTLVAGDADPFMSDDTRTAMLARLRAWNPTVRSITYAGDHRLHADTLRSLLHGFARGD